MRGNEAREPRFGRRLTLAASPSGGLRLVESPDEDPLDPKAAEAIAAAFAQGPAAGLLHLGAVEVSTRLPPTLGFFRDFARLFVSRLCAIGDLEERRDHVDVPATPDELDRLAGEVPPMAGGEYIDGTRLRAYWTDLEEFFREEARGHRGAIQSYLQARNPIWNLVGRVYFHLAENKQDDEHPFAFLATYTLVSPARPDRSISRSHRRSAPSPGIAPRCSRCSCQSNGPPRTAVSSRRWWTRVISSSRWPGRRAGMCKHVAATLYGVGARLDEQPDLFFRLRHVDQTDLLTAVGSGTALAERGGAKRKRIADSALAEVFGIEIDEPAAAAVTPAAPAPAKKKREAPRRPAGGTG